MNKTNPPWLRWTACAYLLFTLAVVAQPSLPLPPPDPSGAVAFWPLESPPWMSRGKPARAFTNVNLAPSWDYEGTTLSIDTNVPAFVNLNVFETNRTNITLASGSLEIWCQANWTSTADGGTGPGAWATIWDIGSYKRNASIGAWLLTVDPSGSNLVWVAQSGGSNQMIWTPIDFDAGDFHQIVATWSASNACLYVDGALATNAGPILYQPSTTECSNDGFCVGSLCASGTNAGTHQFRGQLQWLASYSYPLSTNEVADSFATISAYIGNFGYSAPGGGGGFSYGDTAPALPEGGGITNGGGTNSSGGSSFSYTFSTNGLWLSIFDVSNAVASLALNNATNYVYEVYSTEVLSSGLTNWNIETEVFPTNTSVMPFAVPVLDRTNDLYFYARDWTGITNGTNQTPEWWFYYWFGTIDLSDTNLDGLGNTLLSDYQNSLDPDIVEFNLFISNKYVASASVPMQLAVVVGTPFYMTALVDDTNFNDAAWVPFNSNLVANIGSTPGWHQIWVGARGLPSNSIPGWNWYRVKLLTPPVLVITNPVTTTVTQPMIEVQGYSAQPLTKLFYDISNATGLFTNQQAFVTSQYYDSNSMSLTTNFFQAFDVPLTNGANVLTFHATDPAGNITTTNLTYTVDYSTKTNPPTVNLYWPQNQTAICGTNYTWRGWISDFTATVTAQIVDTNGNTNIFNAIVERNGNFWIENMPLSSGTNYLTLTVVDVVGNVATTNITVSPGAINIAINPPSSSLLWNQTITVTGTISDSSDYTLWVNGAQATLNGDGTWQINNVYLPLGGTAVIQARAIPNTDNGGNGVGGSGGGPVSYGNLGNPDSTLDSDDELQTDRPTTIYVQSYDDSGTSTVVNNYGCGCIGTATEAETWSVDGGFGVGGGATGSNIESESGCAGSGSTSVSYVWDWPCDSCSATATETNSGGYSESNTYAGGGTWVGEFASDNDGMGEMAEFSWSQELTQQVGYGSCPSNSYTATSSETTTSQTMLQTGGKSSPKPNLYKIGVSATEWDLACDTPYEYLSIYPFTTSAIAPADITVLGQSPGPDGNLWLLLPPGATFDVTPQAPPQNYTYTLNGMAYTLSHVTECIAGGNIDTTRTTIGIGERVDLSGMPDIATWTVSGGGTLSTTNGSETIFAASLDASLLC